VETNFPAAFFSTVQSEAGFSREKFPDCASETIKAIPFHIIQKIMLSARNDLACVVFDVQTGNLLL
jgi:hypothetical protein